MPLRDRLPVDGYVTLGEYEVAGEDRFRDAMVLARQGRRMGAIYMFGYVVEAMLKCAFFRLLDYRPETLIRLGAGGVDDPRQLGRTDLGVTEHAEGPHNPLFWARMVVELRIRNESPLSAEATRALISKAQRIRNNWKVAMRYCRDRSDLTDLREVWKDVMWMRTQYSMLWS